MSYFPAFIKLENKKILIVGGGKIAYEKLEHLLDFTQDICIISKKVSDIMLETIEKNSLSYEKRLYKRGDIKEFRIVVVATDDIQLQEEIFKESKQYDCLCNCVDSVEYCDFIFPAYFKKDDLIVAVSTSGSSPSTAKYLRMYFQNLIPDSISSFLKEMRSFRNSMPKGKDRMKILDEKSKSYVEKLR